MVLLARQQRPHRLVDPASVDRGHRPADALASESCPFEHAFGFAVANLDVGNDATDSEIERVLCERTCGLGRDAASSGVWVEPIPDLDDRPLRVEVTERAAAEDLACLDVGDDERHESAARDERVQSREELGEIGVCEGIRFGEGRRHSGKVSGRRKPQDKPLKDDALLWDRPLDQRFEHLVAE